jgi:hypothetical protein
MNNQISRELLLKILMNSGLYNTETEAEVDLDLLSRISPRPGRIIVSKPEISAYHGGRLLNSGLMVPEVARSVMKEFGLICTVLKVGPDVDPEVQAGAAAVIPEYAGMPMYLGRETPYWILGEQEIMVILSW